MGKRSDFERLPRDYYVTPKPAFLPLVPYLRAKQFVEPCAGNGALVDMLIESGFECAGKYDIEPMREDIIQKDALTLTAADIPFGAEFITNPPWKRDILHPLIEHLSNLAPTWLLFDADWPHTVQSAGLIDRCEMIVPVGRIKWIPDSPHTGKDNCCWYRFTAEGGVHTGGAVFKGRKPKK